MSIPDYDMAVQTRGLTKVFKGQTALQDLDLEVPRGGVFALLGPNSAGKTTTIKLLMNLLQPTSGEMKVLGLDPVQQGVAVRSRTGYQPETGQMPEYARVGDLLELCRSLYPNWNVHKVETYRREFELDLKSFVKQLSKGKVTLLALLLALGPEPDLLLLDEPGTGLDPLRRRQVIKLLVDEVAGEGRTIFLSSHNLPDVERLADRVGFLNRGRLILSRPLDQLLAEEKKIWVVCPEGIPGDLADWPGVRRIERENGRTVLVVSGQVEEIAEKLRSLDRVTFEILDQTLEDIFITYAEEQEHATP
ncbi:MAG TPA: ABC transporter ATP-binding protein [Spirochaetia bacterium]|nr:ABC transporter ATP-binding protein [Spirochaetia bacterium]